MAAAVAFLGALGAAMKFWNKPAPAPEKGNDMGALLQRVAKLEQREDAAETARKEQREDFGTARKEQREDFGTVFAKLDELTELVARMDGKLGARGGR